MTAFEITPQCDKGGAPCARECSVSDGEKLHGRRVHAFLANLTAAEGLYGIVPETDLEWLVWQYLPRRSDKRAAPAKRCCVSEVRKSKVGFVRKL